MHNMARMMMSTLLDIGLDKRGKKDIESILDPESMEVGSAPANAQGLFLQGIEY